MCMSRKELTASSALTKDAITMLQLNTNLHGTTWVRQVLREVKFVSRTRTPGSGCSRQRPSRASESVCSIQDARREDR